MVTEAKTFSKDEWSHVKRAQEHPEELLPPEHAHQKGKPTVTHCISTTHEALLRGRGGGEGCSTEHDNSIRCDHLTSHAHYNAFGQRSTNAKAT